MKRADRLRKWAGYRFHGVAALRVGAAVALVAGLAALAPAGALASAFPAEINLSDLNGANGFTLGADVNLYGGGYSVSAAGDVNGDGIADFVVGAPRGGELGRSYVVFGTDLGFPARMSLSALDGTDGFALTGADFDDGAGWKVSVAGDVNGDGFDDIAIGAVITEKSYVVFGTDLGFPAVFDLSTLDGANGFVVNAFNSDISGAGDVNGDGIADIIVGDSAYGYGVAPGYGYLGRAHVVFGTKLGFPALVDTGTLDGSNGFALEGVDSMGQIGLSVSGAGDFNGDGIDDIIVGAGPYTLSGEFFILFGTGAGFPAVIRVSDLDGANGFAIFGTNSGGDFSVSEAGDVNGDGIADVIIGDPYRPDASGNVIVGRIYVLFGARRVFPAQFYLSAVDGVNGFALIGAGELDYFGYYSGFDVSGAGDVNGDGIDDVVVGAPGVDANGIVDSGRSYVVFGSNKGFPAEMALSTLDGTNGFALNGVALDDWSGFGVAGAGDVNGDGVDDLIVSALLGGPDELAYVVFGRRVPVVTVSGVCPGKITVDITGLTPNGTAALFSAAAEGSSTVPAGRRCTGMVLDLDNPSLENVGTADASGTVRAITTVGPGVCGRFYQVADATTCTPGNVVLLPFAIP